MAIQICDKRLKELAKLAELENRFLLCLCILNFVFCIVAILGNLLVIRALWKAKMMSASLKAMFLSLAFSDLAVGLFVQPVHGAIISVVLAKAADGIYNVDFLCPVFVTLYLSSAYFFAMASFLSIITITVDRFLAVSLHLRYSEFVTRKRVVTALVMSWSTSGVITIVYIALPNYNDMVAVVLEVMGLFVTSVAYLRIYQVARHHERKIHSQCQVTNDLETMKMARVRRSAYNAFFVYAAFVACYTPNIFFGTLLVISDFPSLSLIVGFYVTIFLIFLNSSVNLLVYCWRYKEIREIVKTTIVDIFKLLMNMQCENDNELSR